MYDVGEEDSDAFIDESQNSLVRQSYPTHMQLPVIEIMKVLACYSRSLSILMYFCCFADVSIIATLQFCHSTFIFQMIYLKLCLLI